MASIQIKCPGCAVTLRLSKPVPPGKQLKCPKCAKMFVPPPPQGILEVPPKRISEPVVPVLEEHVAEIPRRPFAYEQEPGPRGSRISATPSTIVSSSEDRTMAMLCHLLGIFTSFLGPLIIWLIKKDQSRYVDYHGREVLNFKINLIGMWLIMVAIVVVVSLVTCGFGVVFVIPLYFAPWIFALVVLIIGAVKANRGELYHFPLTIRVIPLPAGDFGAPVVGRSVDEEGSAVGAGVPASQPSPWPKILLFGGIGAGVLMFVVCGVVGYWFYRAKQGAERGFEEFQANMKAKGFVPPKGINDPFAILNPPANLDEALAALQSGELARQLLSANWLARTNVDPARQAEVAKALQTLLTNPDRNLQLIAMKALVPWATADNVPAIIVVVQNDEFNPQANEMRHLGMDALARLKDERGVAPVAHGLISIHDRSNASKALQAMGPIAEKEVAKYLEDKDAGTQREACRILKAIGTQASIPALEAASKNRNRTTASSARDALNAIKARGN